MRSIAKRRRSIASLDLFSEGLGQPARSLDGMLVALTLALTLSGLIMVFSASGVIAEAHHQKEATHFLLRQAVWLTLGGGVMIAVARLPYTVWRSGAPILLLGCGVLLLAVLVVGETQKGAQRWFHLGPISLQPSEPAKLAMVLYLSRYLTKPDLRLEEWMPGFLSPILLVGVFCGLIVAEPDLGSAVVLGVVSLGMLFLGGARWFHLSVIGVSMAAAMGWLIKHSPERMERLLSFWNPEAHKQGGAYQVWQSMLAFEHGGILGVGLGEGKQKLQFLPEGHTDFVLALLGEELGLVGTTVVLLLYAGLVLKGFRIASQAQDPFGRHLALGVTLLFGVQVLINTGVVCGLLPTTGLTLPFLSYGGSSLLTSMAAVGILLSVARYGTGRLASVG